MLLSESGRCIWEAAVPTVTVLGGQEEAEMQDGCGMEKAEGEAENPSQGPPASVLVGTVQLSNLELNL